MTHIKLELSAAVYEIVKEAAWRARLPLRQYASRVVELAARSLCRSPMTVPGLSEPQEEAPEAQDGPEAQEGA